MTEDVREKNVEAFLDAIAMFESAPGPAGYRTLYGGSLWKGDLSAHPAEQDWPGVYLPPEMCKRAGIRPPCKSTAAGRYQFRLATWLDAKHALGLTDFEPDSQDRAATWLIAKNDALQCVESGDFNRAIQLCRNTWASMPGNTDGQGSHDIDRWRSIYSSAGGEFT